MYKFILSFRYLFKKRISYLAFLAVALCVFIVVVVMTVMTGLVGDFKRKNHDFAGDCVVSTESLVGFAYYEDFVRVLEQADFVRGVSPVIKSYALISAQGSGNSGGVEIMGIDPARHSVVTGFGKSLYYRKDDPARAFIPAYGLELAGCVLGIDLAMERNAQGSYYHGASPFKAAFLISCFPLTARGALARAGTDIVSSKTFYFSDTSRSGIARVDGLFVYLPFEDAQLLCGMAGTDKRASAIHISFAPGVKLQEGCEKVTALWGDFKRTKGGESQANLLDAVTIQSWKESRRQYIAAMEKEQTMFIAMFSLVGITTVFIIFVVFYMIIRHKTKDIGILKSIGVSSGNIVGLFLLFAFMVSVVGSFSGTLLGWLFLRRMNDIENWLFERFGFQLWDRTMYAIGDIPSQVSFGVLLPIIISAVVACLVGAMIPAWQAARLKPVETLQVNQL